MSETAESVAEIGSDGLHARPTVRLVRLADSFASSIWLQPISSSEWTDAKSVVRVMRMKLRGGTSVTVRAEGTDAGEAVSAIVQFLGSSVTSEA